MRFAIIDRNAITRRLLADWLRTQVILSPQDQESRSILQCASIDEVLNVIPSLDALWLEATPYVHQDIDEIRARGRAMAGSLQPVIVLILDKTDPQSIALVTAKQLVPLQSIDIRSFLNSYRVVELLLNNPKGPEQVFHHT